MESRGPVVIMAQQHRGKMSAIGDHSPVNLPVSGISNFKVAFAFARRPSHLC
jgi:hypothetical protein